ncbi:hypothetical protein SAMN04487859_103191 [Roseovarius lutimaris]|uniref:Uncharacterized protein n=1 Tax=Roseovarius lutimaris TaxID=1005928 RepID=A0A1I4ZFM4_9RHOB|nr:hypothetical protein [Roseovarius lutimaris]SFN49066.1 hypothetical protein SAMN04487859_103191 [Roseovarius lutimaris]
MADFQARAALGAICDGLSDLCRDEKGGRPEATTRLIENGQLNPDTF